MSANVGKGHQSRIFLLCSLFSYVVGNVGGNAESKDKREVGAVTGIF